MPTETFTADSDWTVPDGVFSATVTLEAEGAGGGGSGGRAVGELSPIFPSETLAVRFLAGGDGDVGIGAADGGDGCDIRRNGTTLSDRVVAAGGAGGIGASPENSSGGDGGGLEGQNGSGAGRTGTGSFNGGEGGTQTAGGAGGTSNDGANGQDGSFGFGGGGADAAGGGGSGWYGGGGGSGNGTDGASGGGASNYVDGLDTVTANERGTSPRSPGDGALVTIEYPDPTPGAENLAITDTTPTSNTLDWDAPTLPPEVDSVEQYRVYRATDPGTVRADYTEVGTTPTTGFDDTGLANGTEYHYRIGADLFVPVAEGTITITGFRGV